MPTVISENSGKNQGTGKSLLIISAILTLIGFCAGLFAVQKGVFGTIAIDTHAEDPLTEPTFEMYDTDNIAFIEIDPIMVSLVDSGDIQYLRFRAHLEIFEEYKPEVTKLLPRIVDVLNGYLRALEIDDFRSPTALIRLRGQMLHRVQIVVGRNRVRDLLIMEFVLN